MAWLYHEPQVGALCAVHAINTLLQGPWITEVELAQIAQELDALERELLGGAAMGEEEHGNLDNSGMFSSQVLSTALKTWDLTIAPITSPEMAGVAEEPQKEVAFICNLQEHWFTIRRVGDTWYNFNSVYPAPEALGTFYLAAYLASLREQGYTIFVVRGVLPPAQQPTSESGIAGGQGGRWFTPQQAKQAHDEASKTRQTGKTMNALEQALARAQAAGGALQLKSRRGAGAAGASGWGVGHGVSGGSHMDVSGSGGVGGDEDADLAAAIAASLGHEPGAQGLQEEDSNEDTALAAALAASQQDYLHQQQPGHTGGGGGPKRTAAQMMGEDEDADLAAALAASQAEALAALRSQDPDLAAAWELSQVADAAEAASRGAAGVAGAAGAAGSSSAAAAAAVAVAAPQPALEPLEPEPEQGEGVLELAFRLPGGGRVMRRFRDTQPTSQIYSFVCESQKLAPGSVVVATQFPRKEVLCDKDTTLAAAGLQHRQALTVDKK